jgi:hypothetical protein
MKSNSRLAKVGMAAGGLVAGVVLAGTVAASAATPTPTPSTSSSTAVTPDANPGDNGADGVPEANEVHGGHGGALNLSGTVTAVDTAANTITIKTATATTVYTVTSSSDIDKNGEAALSALAAGDAVTFNVDSSNAKQIDKLHTGDEAKNKPAATPSSTSGAASSSGA